MTPEEELAEEALEAEADAAHYGREHRRWLEWRGRANTGPDKELEEAQQKVEDAPKCQDDGASLVFLSDDNKCLNAPHSSGFGCPECGAIYCPFCYDDVRTDPVCEHFIVGSQSSEYFYGNNPFDEDAYHAAQAKYLAKKETFASGVDWSERQKETAFGTLLPFFRDSEGFGDGSDFAVDFLEALPPIAEWEKVSFYCEDGSPSALWLKGFLCDKPEIAHSYYKEQAALLLDGLNALAEMEPEGTSAS